MRYKDIITLVGVKYTEDELKNQMPQEIPRDVYANSMAIGINEVASAGQIGLKPSKAFKINAFEYNDEQKIVYNQKSYRVYRIAENGDKVTLYCQKAIADTKRRG